MSPNISADTSELIGSPFKRARSSVSDLGTKMFGPLGSNTNDAFPPTTSGLEAAKATGEQHGTVSTPDVKVEAANMESDEEL